MTKTPNKRRTFSVGDQLRSKLGEAGADALVVALCQVATAPPAKQRRRRRSTSPAAVRARMERAMTRHAELLARLSQS